MSTPNVGGGYNDLFGVAASTAFDAWAVGYSRDTAYSASRTLILHWDGISWRVVSSPSPSTAYNVLYGVVAIAPDDAWAVGWYNDLQQRLKTMSRATKVLQSSVF